MGANTSTPLHNTSAGGLTTHNKKALHLASKAANAHLLEQLLQPLVSAVTAEIAARVYPGPAAAALSKALGRKDRHGRTALLQACLSGSWECAELLLEAGSNMLAADADGNGCLHLASINGHGHVVEQLLAKAETQGIAARVVNTTNLAGATPLHYAAWSGHAHIVRQLLVATSTSDRLLLQGTTDTYDRWLLVPLGATALHVAAQQQCASVVLIIMQHYALLLRDWVPVDGSSRRPTDPRNWTDANGATPLHVALWKGLDPSSQLATLLHPRTDVTTLFSLQQLEDLRKRGPPTLQVIAVVALRAKLLRQLKQQQHLLQEQQQLLALQEAAREQQRQQELQQQRQRRQQESRQHQDRIWQRWWGRDGPDTAALEPTAAAAAAAVGDTARTPQHGLSADQQQLLPASISSKAERSLHSKASSTLDGNDRKGDSPWRELRRTPSITLGAVQQYSSLQQTQQQDQQTQQQTQQQQQRAPQQQPIDMAVAALLSQAQGSTGLQSLSQHSSGIVQPMSSEIEPAVPAVQQQQQQSQAPATPPEATNHAQAQGAAAAAAIPPAGQQPGVAAAVTVAAEQLSQSQQQQQQQTQLQSASSITLGCLDRVWLAASSDKQQQEQQGCDVLHGKLAAAAAAAQAAHTGSASHAVAAQHKGLDSRLCVSAPTTPEPGTVNNTAARCPATAATSSSTEDSGSSNTSNDALAMPCCGTHMQLEEHSGTAAAADPLYKGVGAFGSFQLQALPLAADNTSACKSQQAASPAAAAPAGTPSAAQASNSKTSTTAAGRAAVSAAAFQTPGQEAAQLRGLSHYVPTDPAGAHAGTAGGGSRPGSSSNLAATSITLAQLPDWQQQEQGQEQEQGQNSAVELAQKQQQHKSRQDQQQQHQQQVHGDHPRGPVAQQARMRGMFSRGRPPLRQASFEGRMHPVLATAGIKNGNVSDILTPLAWKLLQQQHQDDRHSKQQAAAQQAQVGRSSPGISSSSSSSSRSSPFSNSAGQPSPSMVQQQRTPEHNKQQQQQRQQQQDWQTRRTLAQHSNTHRRSFELPGSTAEVFMARREHVARMLSQSQLLSRHSLLGAAAAQSEQGRRGASHGGSRRSSLDRTGLTLDVATSLAGALPGCVSEKLSQYLQVYGTGAGVAVGAAGAADAAAGGSSSSRVGARADSGVGCTSLVPPGGAAVASAGGADVDPSSPGRAPSQQAPAASLLSQQSTSYQSEGASRAATARSSFLRFVSGAGGGSSSRGAAAANSIGTETCAVCMDQECAVALVGCGHSLCFSCAGCIVGQGLGVRPPLCPFCRRAIAEVQACALAGCADGL